MGGVNLLPHLMSAGGAVLMVLSILGAWDRLVLSKRRLLDAARDARIEAQRQKIEELEKREIETRMKLEHGDTRFDKLDAAIEKNTEETTKLTGAVTDLRIAFAGSVFKGVGESQ